MNNPTSMTDEKLIQFYLNGDSNALATLVELYKDRIYRSIYSTVQDKYAAEEIFHEVFIRIINNLMAGKTAEEGNFLGWAIQIGNNLCIEYSRKSKTSVVMDESIPIVKEHDFFIPLASNNTNYYECHGKLKSMIDMLPDKQREVIVLNHYAGLSVKQIADRMKCSLNTALTTMKFGLNNLQKLMTEKEVILQ